MSKIITLVLLLILSTSSLIMVESAFAQSIPKPSVPEFTLNLISSPPESQFVNKTIELTIKNQPFTPYYDRSSGWNISFYYNVQIKTNENNWSVNWTTLYTVDELPAQSNNNYTVFLYPSNQPVDENDYYLGDRLLELPPGTRIDFQVEAIIGYVHRDFIGQPPPYYFTGEESGWSKTQTVTIPANSTLPSPTPTVPEFPTLIILPLFAVLILFSIVFIRKRIPAINLKFAQHA